MATATNLALLSTRNRGEVHVNELSQQSADRVSELLMQNHEKFHILFHGAGLHNHIVHHLLTIYALCATPDEIQGAYDLNTQYQLPIKSKVSPISGDMRDPAIFGKFTGNPKYYKGFLEFFTRKVSEKGVKQTLDEYLFKADDRANDMLARLYDGLLHSFIHLGYGIEFQQPLIVVEALAQAAITERWLEDTCDLVSRETSKDQPNGKRSTDLPLLSLYYSLSNDPVISNAVRPNDPPNKLRDGLIARAKHALIPYLAQFTVKPEQLEQKATELANTSLYVAASAQRPGKIEMFDFFLMHSVNASLWLSVFLKQEWISIGTKCKLVELKGWSDLITYAACRTPALYPDRILQYQPKHPGDWDSIYRRARRYNDDGHAAKFVRSIRNIENISRKFASTSRLPLQQQDCLTIAHMVMDSVERMNNPDYRLPRQATFMPGVNNEVLRVIFRWVRWNGLDEAWNHVPDLGESAKL